MYNVHCMLNKYFAPAALLRLNSTLRHTEKLNNEFKKKKNCSEMEN